VAEAGGQLAGAAPEAGGQLAGAAPAAGVRNTWVRVWTEEYEGRQGITRRFIAASYKVRAGLG
jgi:hypothetical protein